jgi:uncharacterized protein with HEPN domain
MPPPKLLPLPRTRTVSLCDIPSFRFFYKAGRESSLDTDRQLVLSLVKSIEIIGEAAANVTTESREALPHIPWRDIVSMRNRLIHAYFDINLDILRKTVIEDLPPLLSELEKIVKTA